MGRAWRAFLFNLETAVVWAGALLAFALPLGGNATTPADFDHAWRIVTTRSAQQYRLNATSELAAATRHGWNDIAVLDAKDQSMPGAVTWPATTRATHLDRLPCMLVGDPNIAQTVYRCVSSSHIAAATGLRTTLSSYRANATEAIALEVADTAGNRLASVPLVDNHNPSLTIRFVHPTDLDTLLIRFEKPGFEVHEIAVTSNPAGSASGFQWVDAPLLQADADARYFVYANTGESYGLAWRIVFADLPDPALQMKLDSCVKRDCPRTIWNEPVRADTLDLGVDATTLPLTPPHPIGNKPFVHLESSHPLARPPRLEIGIKAPLLLFQAKGTPPYTLVAGQRTLPDNAHYGLRAGDDDRAGMYSPIATLESYSALAHTSKRLLDYTGPLLILLALGAAIVWACQPAVREA